MWIKLLHWKLHKVLISCWQTTSFKRTLICQFIWKSETIWIQHRSYTWLWATWANFVVCIVVYTSTDGGFPPLYVLENITIETHDCIYRKAVKFLIPYLYSHPFAEIGWMGTLLLRVWALVLRFSIQVGFWNFRFMRSWVNELVNQMIITKILWTDALSINSQNNTAWYSKLFCQVECLCSAMRYRVTWSNSKPGSRLIESKLYFRRLMIRKW